MWGNPGGGIELSARERPLSQAIMRAWGRFADTGDPGSDVLPWPRYSREHGASMIWDLPPALGAAPDPPRDVCDLWDKLER